MSSFDQIMLQWIAERQAILVSLFLAYFMNFIFQWIANQSHDKCISNRIRILHFKLLLFGSSSLLACNLVQSGIYQAALSFFILVSLIVCHILSFKQVPQKYRDIAILIYHGLIVAFSIGTIVHALILHPV